MDDYTAFVTTEPRCEEGDGWSTHGDMVMEVQMRFTNKLQEDTIELKCLGSGELRLFASDLERFDRLVFPELVKCSDDEERYRYIL